MSGKAYCPTNVYSVGTPHEIVLCRQQRKPVLFVSPQVTFSSLEKLRFHLHQGKDMEGMRLLEELVTEVPIKANPEGVPSLWYMPLIGGEHFFDGFGFSEYRKAFKWQPTRLDEMEQRRPPKKPLLPFLESLNQALPEKWSRELKRFVPNDDWLLWDLRRSRASGSEVKDVHQKVAEKQASNLQ